MLMFSALCKPKERIGKGKTIWQRKKCSSDEPKGTKYRKKNRKGKKGH